MEHGTISSHASQLEQLVLDALQDMQRLGYSPKYLRLCRGVWRSFLNFARSCPTAETFSDSLVMRFLATRGIPTDDVPSALTSRQRLIRAVMRILIEFNLHGCYQRRGRTARSVNLSVPFQALLNTYGVFCRNHLRCTPGTMRCRMRHLTRFLHFLESRQTSELSAIQATHISDFLRSQVHLRPKTVAVIVSDLRSLLRFLCMQGILSDDLSVHVPQVRVARDGRLPSVWSGADVEALLAAVDRASPKGKRDYAILLLACRLGLRVSDIRGLCLENLHWREDRIEMTQTKTGCAFDLAPNRGGGRRPDRLPTARTPRHLSPGGVLAVEGSSRAVQQQRQPSPHPHFLPPAGWDRLARPGPQGPAFAPPYGGHALAGGRDPAGDHPRSPLRHCVLPAIIRVLYGCGPRVGEVVALRVGEVDLLSGILVVREGKYRKDRLVPVAPSLCQYLRRDADSLVPVLPMSPSSRAPTADLTTV